MIPIDPPRLAAVFIKAANRQVELSVTYHECCDQWSAKVFSAAPSERFETNWYSFPTLMEILEEKL